LPKVQACHERSQRKGGRARAAKHKGGEAAREARVSTTDPEARVMKMGDGGFRPAYNVQFATTTADRVIVGVEVCNEGTDAGQMVPMIEQIAQRTGQRPTEYLVDGGYTKLSAIDALESRGTQVYAPVAASRDERVDRYARKRDDTDHTARWRARMNTAEARAIYRERASTAETVHADLRAWRGLRQMPVRGQSKVRSVALWMAVTHNLMRAEVLRRTA
jgi:hypothetical protein